jgi:cytochrome c biogenesis protein CcmG, thiol:disulfide interchange protein DsbE
LLAAKLTEHADDGMAIVGILTDDPAPLARDFVAEFGATWPTVEDPDKADKTAYRVLGRPQTFFIDGSGVVRSVQIGEVRDTDFETHYARIAP